MSEIDILPAPQIDLSSVRPRNKASKWEQERNAFRHLLPTLLPTYRGQYVAIHEANVVDHGDDEIALAIRVYRKIGYVPIYVGLVSDEPPRILRIPTPRLLRRDTIS